MNNPTGKCSVEERTDISSEYEVYI